MRNIDTQIQTIDILADNIARELKEMRLRERQAELKERMVSSPPFSVKESTEAAKRKRTDRARKDFWFFDKTYFPPEVYQDYAPPGKFHRDLVDIGQLQDKKAHVVEGPRSHGKTATYKKFIMWSMLYGHRRYIQIASETLESPAGFLLDVMDFVHTSERLNFDFEISFVEGSDAKILLRTDHNPAGTYISTLSEKKSSRGKNRGLFLRPDFIYVTDLETETSSFDFDMLMKRFKKLNEMRTSLADRGTLIWEGNNFHTDCLMNHLNQEAEAGILSPEVVLHIYAAWDGKRVPTQRSLWPQKYPAKSEEDLRSMLKPLNDHDWAGNFQQEPIPETGDIFPKEHYIEQDAPADLMTVLWCDPNLSLKHKGDTTAITCLGFSVSRMAYFSPAALCKSYSDSNNLLSDLFNLFRVLKLAGINVITIGFDGNVSQEATWTNHIINYARIHNTVVPHVEFRKYTVDNISKNPELDWKDDKISFPVGFAKTEQGERYTKQVFAFRGKKAKKKDDAPDSLICAYELLNELGAVRMYGATQQIVSISNRKITERL